MTIKYASDLHLELQMNSRWLRARPLLPPADIFVLAGNIITLGDDRMFSHPFFDWCENNFNRTYIVPGELECVSGMIMDGSLEVRNNIYYINNRSVQIKPGLEIYFTTRPDRPLDYRIVVSHFPPDLQSLEASKVEHWIFGHTGSNGQDWRRVLKKDESSEIVLHTNQLGPLTPLPHPAFCMDDVINV